MNNSCFGIFMYKFVCFTMSSKLLCSNNFTQNVKLMNHYPLKCYRVFFFIFFIFKDPKIVLEHFLSSFFSFKQKFFELMSSFISYNLIFYASQKLYGKSFLFQKYRFYYKNNNKQVSLRLDEIEIIKPIFTI